MTAYKRVKGGEKTGKSGIKWNKDEIEKVFDLFIEIEGRKIHENNPKIQKLAKELDRPIRTVEAQLLMFRNLDRGGEYSRKNMSKLTEQVWQEKMELKLSTKKSPRDKINDIKIRQVEYAPGERLHYDVSSGLKDLIGKQLITDDFVAVFELVKNSFDARATMVDITFSSINDKNSKIIIEDNGKGMNYEDLVKKWLFVGYSAKRDGTEDIDYRENLGAIRFYAGAKGVGRFSCDRLGSKLKLISRKKEINSSTEIIYTDWEKFEENALAKFEDIGVTHQKGKNEDLNHKNGTKLEITELRNTWDRLKFLRLKRALEKLISPSRDETQQDFMINLNVPTLKEVDEKYEDSDYYNRVNGPIKNFIFELLGVKSTYINVRIDNTGEYMQTELVDRGVSIYKIKELNKHTLLHDINFRIFYLNQAAKYNFKRLMGLPTSKFGSVFLYKNNFRINPYGNADDDSFDIEKRYGTGIRRYFARRNVIGRVEVFGENKFFEETTSRDGGLIKNDSVEELKDFLLEVVIKRLENYVVDVINWGTQLTGENIEDLNEVQKRQAILDLIADLTNPENILDFEYNPDIVDILETRSEKSAKKILENLRQIALETNDSKVLDDIIKAEERIDQLEKIKIEAEQEAKEERKRAKRAEKDLDEKISENLFLQSLKSQDFDEIVSLMHHIGIYAGTIENYLSTIYLSIAAKEEISSKELEEVIKIASFELKKILNITKFGTKANFKLKTEYIEIDLDGYIKEYVNNVLQNITEKGINISYKSVLKTKIQRRIKPIELNIVIDNLINNAKKADSKNIQIELKLDDEGKLELTIKDDGIGIAEENISKIFNFGFTTTSGSGLGLYHVNSIMKELNASVKVSSVEGKGSIFTIKFN